MSNSLCFCTGADDPLNANIEKFDPQLIESFTNHFISGDYVFHHLEDEYYDSLWFTECAFASQNIIGSFDSGWQETDIFCLRTSILHLAACKELISPSAVLRKMNELLEEPMGKYDIKHDIALNEERALFIQEKILEIQGIISGLNPSFRRGLP